MLSPSSLPSCGLFSLELPGAVSVVTSIVLVETEEEASGTGITSRALANTLSIRLGHVLVNVVQSDFD